jgi:hypothetical protein
MLECWEWLIIVGAGALTMTAVLVVSILYFFSKPKVIVSQGYTPQQYSQRPPPQYQMSVNRICMQCGFSMAGNTKFCSNCGKQLN